MVEVETGHLCGLAQAAAALPKHRPLVLCERDREEPARQARFTVVVCAEFLFDRW